MRVYFIFDIKEQFISLYQNNYRVLYNILRQIYYLNNREVTYGYSLFRQLTNFLDKSSLDRKIYLDYHKNISYTKTGDKHIINNLYKDEVSKMIIKNAYIMIQIESGNSSFFNVIRKYSNNYFACDFKRGDYFFLTERKSYNYKLSYYYA